MKDLIGRFAQTSLVTRIIVGLILGIILGIALPEAAQPVAILGTLFVSALKAIAPILVFVLVIAALCQPSKGKSQQESMKAIVPLYIIGPFIAALVAVAASTLFPVTLDLKGGTESLAAPGGIAEVLEGLLMNLVSNPIQALAEANYIGILFWAALLGFALKKASENTRTVFTNLSDSVSQIVKWVISFAPLGIMGLVFDAIATGGLGSLVAYGRLLAVLLGCMAVFTLIVNPAISFFYTRRNPYPLVFRCLKESGLTAFFTRSSAANIPVNMTLCEKLGLDKDVYSVAVPLGTAINMAGAAITINVFTLATVSTMGIEVDFMTAILLSVVATVSSLGASGVGGGSLLLIPLACSLFGISNDIAMEVVAIGFIVGVIQDSCETALNSHTDVVYIASVEYGRRRKAGQAIPLYNEQKETPLYDEQHEMPLSEQGA